MSAALVGGGAAAATDRASLTRICDAAARFVRTAVGLATARA